MERDLNALRQMLVAGKVAKKAATVPPPIDPTGTPAGAAMPVPPPGAMPAAPAPGMDPMAAMGGAMPPGMDPMAAMAGAMPPGGGAPMAAMAGAMPPGMDPAAGAMPPGVDPSMMAGAPPLEAPFPAEGGGGEAAPTEEEAKGQATMDEKLDRLLSEIEALKTQLSEMRDAQDDEGQVSQTLEGAEDMEVPEEFNALDLTGKTAEAEPEPDPTTEVGRVKRLLGGLFRR